MFGAAGASAVGASRMSRTRLSANLISGTLHGAVLLYLVLGGRWPRPEPAVSMYDQEIRPHERRIVWYHVRGNLPDVSASGSVEESRPLRALRRFDQSIVAGRKDDPNAAPQLVWNPEPEVSRALSEQLPNLLAVSVPKPVRSFRAP